MSKLMLHPERISSYKNNIVILTSLFCLFFLFIGGPNYHSPRSYQYFWDFGHVFAFTIWSALLLKHWPILKTHSFIKQLVSIVFICFVFGGVTEIIQNVSGRTFNYGDIVRDIEGGVIAVVFFSQTATHQKKYRQKIIRFILIAALVFQVFPLAKSLSDEIIAYFQFPVLSDFETPFEISRWGKNNQGSSKEFSSTGKHSLKVELKTTEYSGIDLKYFQRDWRQYNKLSLNIYKKSPGQLKLHIRVNDREHDNRGGIYSDRFSKTVVVDKGWNKIDISIDDIENSPKNRKMNISCIQNLGIFSKNLKQSEIIYIDNVRLLR